MIESLARELDLPIGEANSSRLEVGLSKVLLAKASRTVTGSVLESSDPRLVPPIVEGLRESGQLRAYRPERADEFWTSNHDGWYVAEHDLIATPVQLPVRDKLGDGISAPAALNIWVCDPLLPLPEKTHDWDFIGSFVFIVEELGEYAWPSSWFTSGISALRLLVDDLAAGTDFTFERREKLSSTADTYGRWNSEHPIEKLVRAGGVVGAPRKINCVYKIAYMTNEQAYSRSGENVRVNDILAYPLYISD